MKLLRDYLFFILFIYICSSAAMCNACCLDKDVKTLKKEVKDANKHLPAVLQAVSDQSLDPENSQDRALQEFVTQVTAPALYQFNDVLKLLLANPWMEKASKPLVQEIYTANPDLGCRGADQTEEYEKMKRLMSLYTQKLGEHHPQPCSNCKGGFMQKASRCHFLHEGHAAMMPIVDLLRKGADMESKNPGLIVRYKKLLSDVQAGNATAAERRSSKRKIDSESKEDTYLLEIKTPD